jgi:hypothetical protein
MTAGLVCGILWEFWNIWATTKWIYTVPFFDEFKLFEMTAPGFLGFIPFAIECYTMTACIYLFKKNIGWERGNCQTAQRQRFSAIMRFCIIFISIVFCFAVFKGIDQTTVDSFRPHIKDITTIPAERRARLEQCGVTMVKDLLRLQRPSAHRQQQVLQCIAASREELAAWLSAAELVMLKGMGTHNFILLSTAGVTDIYKLAQQNAHNLKAALEQLQDKKDTSARIPDEAKLNVWIRAAQNSI